MDKRPGEFFMVELPTLEYQRLLEIQTKYHILVGGLLKNSTKGYGDNLYIRSAENVLSLVEPYKCEQRIGELKDE